MYARKFADEILTTRIIPGNQISSRLCAFALPCKILAKRTDPRARACARSRTYAYALSRPVIENRKSRSVAFCDGTVTDSANEHKNGRTYLPLVDPLQFARERAQKKRDADTIWRAVIIAIIIGASRRIAPNTAFICESAWRYDIFHQTFCCNRIF